MDAATLRRLLSDRDGGALSEDVIALLDAHVKLSPAAGSEIETYSATVQNARDAMEPRVPIDLPAFPRDAVATALDTSSPRSVIPFRHRSRVTGLAAAACVVFAFLAGRLSHMTTPPEGDARIQVVLNEPAPRTTSGIWSIDAKRRMPQPEADASTPPIKWNSPLEWSRSRRS